MSPEPVSVRTPRLRLVAPSSEVWRDLLNGVSGPAIEGYPTQGDIVMARLVVDGYLDAGEWGPWQVIDRATGEIVGGVGFKGAPDDEGDVEIGYGLAPTARGRGLATEAVAALIERARAHGVRAVRAEADAGNTASRHVLERSGFRLVEESAVVTRWVRALR